ncbi:MAG TPA: DUF1223 domain-containing protein [Rhizomicrobium sp.]|jgi:hypothetical protein|nr:DUF1223 domain-containing protein [Rhizomicrobium sp.]
MISLRRTLPILFAVLLGSGAALAGNSLPTRPVVVELFTSQGCSSCPPADALLGRLAQRPGVIAITLPITYWDMLGWKDTLASEANTRRQKSYAAAMGHGGVYTPQIVVDGAVDVVGSRAANVEMAIAQRRAMIAGAQAAAQARIDARRYVADQARLPGDVAAAMPVAAAMSPAMPAWADPLVSVALSQSPQEMHVDLGAAPGAHDATVWMVHLRSQVSVAIPAGENEGHTITYHNVVGDLKAIGVYKGRAMTLTLPRAAMAGLPHDGVAVIVQQNGYGHVIGAAYVSRPDYYAQQ